MNDRGYGFAWLAGYRLKCAQTEAIRAGIDRQMACFNAVFYEDAETKAMLDYVMEQLYADPPRFEPFAGVTHPTAAPEVPAIEDPLCGAMTLAYRAPNGDEVFMSEGTRAVDPAPPTFAIPWPPVGHATTSEALAALTQRLKLSAEDKYIHFATKKPRSVLDWVRDLFRRR